MVTPGHFYARILQDLVAQGQAAHWRARADEFESAKPVVSEFHGKATSAGLNAAWKRCDAIARGCRERATLLEMFARLDAEIESRLPQADELAVAVLMWEQAHDGQRHGVMA